MILSLGDALPALMAGNAVVIKPSELTPLTLIEMVRGWREDVGAPDVLAVVNGMAETGGALVDEADYVQFTGSERTGKIVMKRAADTLTPVSLELGGKDPMIVTRDADLERAANATAFGGLAQHRPDLHLDRARLRRGAGLRRVRRQAHRARSKRCARAPTATPTRAEVGAMTSPAQIDIVSDQVEDARAAGARILTGGRRKDGPGDWYEPTLIADVDHSMKVMREETFGPVIPVMKVRDVEEAIELANDTTYGLGSSVFAGDADEGERIARRIEAGPLQRQRRARQLQRPRPADGRLEELRDRGPPRRPGNPPLLPHRGADDPAPAAGEVGADLVPLQPPQARPDPAPLHGSSTPAGCATGCAAEPIST